MSTVQLGKESFSIEVGGRTLTLSSGGFAFHSDAAIIARYGETMILATVVRGRPREDLGYFPLQVEYIERLYAGGRIKGSRWVKREGRPSDEAVLIARLIDRAVRPLFPKGFYDEVQVVLTLLSVDQKNDPVFPALMAATAALQISSLPWQGPLGGIQVGWRDGQPFANPLEPEKDFSDLALTMAAGPEGVVMLEAGAREIKEEDFYRAVIFGQKESLRLAKFVADIGKKIGREKYLTPSSYPHDDEVAAVEKVITAELKKRVENLAAGEGSDLEDLKTLAKDELAEKLGALRVGLAVEKLWKEAVRRRIWAGKRPDGRREDEIRPIWAKVGVLTRTHGSAIFTRGETQVLTVATLGAPSLRQLIESAEGEESKRYIHHYSMPGYATGEPGRFGSPKRREIGHGALAERALEPVIPPEEKFPYTIRVVSEVLSSNGSTSMASVCGSTLSLMDAGVPIKRPVAGISVGLVTKGKEFRLLTDIAGIEDFNGDMDFKVAGTSEGITAVQVDIKIHGLSQEIVKGALQRAREAREKILTIMAEVLPQPRAKISQLAPKIVLIHISPALIGEIIGPGGRIIRKMSEENDCEINVEDDGTVTVSGLSQEGVDKAVEEIRALTHEVKPGEVFSGHVTRIQPFGVFVEFLPGKEGLIHISDLSDGFVKDPARLVKPGQEIKVVVKEIDDMGRVNLRPETPFPGEKRPPRPSGFSPQPQPFQSSFRSRFAGPQRRRPRPRR